SPPAPSNVTVSYDHRAIIVDGRRRLLLAGAIHYPRSSPGMWPFLLERAKAAGLNAVDTYVFWGLHEPAPGVFDFHTDEKNLPHFLELAKKAGLFVVLRIGPYVCAEFNNGGFPVWLTQLPGVRTRTYEPQFLTYMEKFVRKTLEVVEPHLKRLDVGVPWIMCEQGERIDDMRRLSPSHPLMFTELWSGWFRLTHEPLTSRPASDLAFSAARFIAKSGSYVAYYMWHGGTNFGRMGGGPMMATSYDYDAPLDEYGFPHDPKHATLADLHAILNEFEDIIVGAEKVEIYKTR
ncbi:hypothetical protein HK405_015236, partial [Cladochytrium tenue]